MSPAFRFADLNEAASAQVGSCYDASRGRLLRCMILRYPSLPHPLWRQVHLTKKATHHRTNDCVCRLKGRLHCSTSGRQSRSNPCGIQRSNKHECDYQQRDCGLPVPDSILVRLPKVNPDGLRDLLGMAYEFVTRKTAKRSLGHRQRRSSGRPNIFRPL